MCISNHIYLYIYISHEVWLQIVHITATHEPKSAQQAKQGAQYKWS